MSHRNLEEVLQSVRNPVELLRNSQIGPYAFPVVKPEFTNWRDEQLAWRESCALFDQSHHMTDLYVEGPDALRLLSDLAVNSFKNFKVNQAKQFVACNNEGYVIGDAILFYLGENKLNLVGRPPAANWVQYHVETGGYKVTAERDERSAVNKGQRKVFRYQVQGHRGSRCSRLATWDGGTTRLGTVWSLGVRRCGPRSHCRSGPGIRDPSGWIESIPDQLSRIGLDSIAASGDIHE